MRSRRCHAVVLAIATASLVTGCADEKASEATKAEPATLVEIKGSDVKQIVLTKRAAERIGLEMATVGGTAGAATIPYSAVVYDPEGATWAFISPKPLTFMRSPITVTSIAGDQAVLSAGPAPGTPVVTLGTALLYGTENEIGH
jgi:hypothetical protein